jgi:hypothetical protein
MQQLYYRRTHLVPILTWSITVCTFVLLFSISFYSVPIQDGQFIQVTPLDLFDLPLLTIVILACLSLIVSFRNSTPRKAYRGLHIYLALLALAFLSLYYKNMNILYSSMSLIDTIRPLSGLFLTLSASVLLFFFKKPSLKFISYLIQIPLAGDTK